MAGPHTTSAAPGTRLMVDAAGQLLEVTVPAGAVSGAQLQFTLPTPPATAALTRAGSYDFDVALALSRSLADVR